MANLIKNQLFKHLAKYFKNLSTDSFKLSTMKGFCELHNLELNEEVLMELLELPVWLNITRATCSHAAIKIPWSKINSIPICLGLDEVIVEVEICENFRTFKNQTAASQNTSKYGLISKVIDGMRITISSVIVNFTSPSLRASFQLSQLEVESRNPTWKPVPDLRKTYFKDKEKGLVLMFKHIEWQTMKFEAKTESTAASAPLRLICQGSCRVMIKKQIADCQVVGARIVLMFNDLLWVLTDAMLVSAFHFVTYINGLIKRAPLTKKVIEESGLPKTPSKVKLATNPADVKKYLEACKLFSFETSYHLVINCLQVQLCDDLDPEHGRSSLSSLKEGGALHIVVNKFILDIYPYQKALGSRDNWLKYGDPSPNRDSWTRAHLYEFAETLAKGELPKGSSNQRLNELFSSVILLRVGDYTFKCVSTSTSRRGGRKFGVDGDERKFLSTGNFPRDLPAFYLEFNQFYFYEYGSTRVSRTRPVPDPLLFANVAPLRLFFDAPTFLWCNALQANLHKSLTELKQIIPQSETSVTIFTRIEILMPTIILDLGKSTSSVFQVDSYNIESMQLNCSRVVITNSVKEVSYVDQLNKSLQTMGSCSLFTNRDNFPWIKEIDSKPISSGFLNLMAIDNLKYHNQIWVLDCDPIWFDFIEKKTQRARPFIDPFQITIWAYLSSNIFNETAKPTESVTNTSIESDVNIVLCIPTSIKIILDHECYLFLLRVLDKFDEFSEILTSDTRKIEKYHGTVTPATSPLIISLISVVKNVEVEILLEKEEVTKNRSSGSSSIISNQSSPIKNNLAVDIDDINRTKPSDPLQSNFQSNVPDIMEFSCNNERTESFPGRSSSGYRTFSIRGSDLTRSESSSTFGENFSELSPLDDDDRSIRSDLSDEHIAILGLENMVLEEEVYFTSSQSPKVVEEALEATEATLSNDSDDLAVQPKKEIVSLSLIKVKLDTVSFVKQSHGFHSSLLAQLTGVNLDEFQKISFENYKIISKSVSQKEKEISGKSIIDQDLISNLSVRLDTILDPSHKNDLLSANIRFIDASLNNETLLQVLDFLNDPDATSVTPALVHLQDIAFKLIDCSLKTPPMVMNLKDTLIERSKENQINILPSAVDGCKHLKRSHMDLLKPETKLSLNGHAAVLTNLGRDDNELLNQFITENSRLSKEISQLKQENTKLKKMLDQKEGN